MQNTTKTFTVAMGADLPQAAALGFPCADLIYTVQSGRLCRYGAPSAAGTLLGFYPTPGEPAPDPHALARMLLGQARSCRAGGILLDLPEDDSGMALAARLSPMLTGRGLPVFLPVTLAEADPNARLILPSAISGGSFTGMLDHFTARFPPHRLCLELMRRRHDFPIPSPDPSGTRLPRDAFDALLQRAGGHHTSPDLCANYFTYADPDGKPRLTLFDDAATARRMRMHAQQAGITAVFALYAEWGSALADIFA